MGLSDLPMILVVVAVILMLNRTGWRFRLPRLPRIGRPRVSVRQWDAEPPELRRWRAEQRKGPGR